MIGGALLGMHLATASVGVIFGMLAGAAAGWVVAEIMALKARVSSLQKEAEDLRGELAGLARPWRDESAEVGHSAQQRPGERPAAEASRAEGASADVPSRAEPAPNNDIPTPRVVRGVTLGASPPADQPGTVTEPYARAIPARTKDTSAASPRDPDPPRENEIVRAVREYFTGGNTLVRVGIVILFIGIAFLLRYVAERSQVPIELRLAGVAVGAMVLLVLGWRLRVKRPGYALALQGGATAILYLTVFVSMRLYNVLPPAAAFALMVLIIVFSGMLAVLQSSIELAVIGIVGGFAAPILASTGQGDHVVLFSYYAVLNAGILGIAWFKAWRPLNVLGFLFTFVIGIGWGVLRYKAEFFSTTEPFLIFYFLLYVAVAILFASRQTPRLKGYVDGTIVFGTPIAAFSVQSALLHHRSFALAYSALAVSALYLVLAWVLYRRRQETYRLLVEAFMALGVLFLTLAVPLALDGQLTAATWALEGSLLVWVGCRQNRRLPRVSGSLLQFASGVIFWSGSHYMADVTPILNSVFLGGVIIAVGAVFSAHFLNRHRDQLAHYEAWSSSILFCYGLLWWLLAGAGEIHHWTGRYEPAVGLIFVTGTALLSDEIYRRLRLSVARWPVFALLPAMILYGFYFQDVAKHPFAYAGWIAWAAAFAGFYRLLHRHDPAPNTIPARLLHTPSAWLLVTLLGWESAWDIDRAVQGGGSWPAIGWVLLPALALMGLLKLGDRIAWPLARHRETYISAAGGGIALYLAAWVIFTNITMPGDPYPLPYVPFLNPLDLAEVFALLVLARFAWQLYREREASAAKVATFCNRISSGEAQRATAVALAALGFLWLNGVLVRTLHHWAGIPFNWNAMVASTLAQTAVSIFWTVIALTTMLIATRRAQRVIWLGGAVLLAVVVGKLLFVDLMRVGTVERIISFIGVGVLILVIGYFSPLPPAAKEAQ